MGTFIPTRSAFNSANLVVRNRSAQAEPVQKTTSLTKRTIPAALLLTAYSIIANTKCNTFLGRPLACVQTLFGDEIRGAQSCRYHRGIGAQPLGCRSPGLACGASKCLCSAQVPRFCSLKAALLSRWDPPATWWYSRDMRNQAERLSDAAAWARWQVASLRARRRPAGFGYARRARSGASPTRGGPIWSRKSTSRVSALG